MQIFRGFHHPGIARACALTIGNFDGVHRGHQAMLALLNNEAQHRAVPSCVMTFEPHPRDYFAAVQRKPELAPARVATLRDKLTELACCGHTSEDVAEHLADGSFGMAADTAELINAAARRAASSDEGFGEAVGALLSERKAPHLSRALLARCYQLGLPYTLHVALGTDIVHQHPTASGAAIGEASLRDFRILAATVAELGQGGVVLNLGSAVIMPEVFLKALAVARNLGYNVTDFVTANFDMLQHYRPTVNVVQRPVLPGGRGYAITGHHEIMIPLLAAAIHEYAVMA